MKIGAFIPQGWRMDLSGISLENQWETILQSADKIESLGYESIWVYDHFHTVPTPTQDLPMSAGPLWLHYLKEHLKFVLVKCVLVTHIEIHHI